MLALQVADAPLERVGIACADAAAATARTADAESRAAAEPTATAKAATRKTRLVARPHARVRQIPDHVARRGAVDARGDLMRFRVQVRNRFDHLAEVCVAP